MSLSVTSQYPVISGSFKVMAFKRKLVFLVVLCVIALLSLYYFNFSKINSKHNLSLLSLPTIFFLAGLYFSLKLDRITNKMFRICFECNHTCKRIKIIFKKILNCNNYY